MRGRDSMSCVLHVEHRCVDHGLAIPARSQLKACGFFFCITITMNCVHYFSAVFVFESFSTVCPVHNTNTESCFKMYACV